MSAKFVPPTTLNVAPPGRCGDFSDALECYDSRMYCVECDALRAAYTKAAEDYAALTKSLLNAHRVADEEYSEKLKSDVEQVRRYCEKAKEALRVHQKSHKIA
jgi:hypothetical protein